MFPLGGTQGGAKPPNVNLGPTDILVITRARKLSLKIPFDMVKYPFWVHKIFRYTIQHDGGRHIDFRQMSRPISPVQMTTANNCKTAFSLHYMSSRALATTTTSSYYRNDKIQLY